MGQITRYFLLAVVLLLSHVERWLSMGVLLRGVPLDRLRVLCCFAQFDLFRRVAGYIHLGVQSFGTTGWS
jgi:hypothetical protein